VIGPLGDTPDGVPAMAFIGWMLGLRIAYDEMVARSGYVELVHQLGLYSFIIFCLGASLLIWAYYRTTLRQMPIGVL
jgi:hypothetical protein